MQVRTEDGNCPVHVFHPDENAQWPGVIMFMDGLGIRPALFEMGERLASHGYYVLLPDLYYRSGYTATEGSRLFSDPVLREDWTKRVLPTVTIEKIMRDMPVFLDLLDESALVRHGKIGTVGYCLGGKFALAAAAYFPERVAAAASYHGGGLATDAPDSPHLLAPRIKARVYVGGAIEDRGFDDTQKQRLEDALTEAGVAHTVETYNAKHGWVPTDTPVHDPVAAEKHWQTLFDLFDGALKSSRSA
jgi:carboxymethylenebutenolidase